MPNEDRRQQQQWNREQKYREKISVMGLRHKRERETMHAAPDKRETRRERETRKEGEGADVADSETARQAGRQAEGQTLRKLAGCLFLNNQKP